MIQDARNLGLDLRPVESLIPHEETIPGNAERLGQQIQREGVQRDPVIVDRENGIVLDGMHRLSAFKSLGLEYMVCYLVDYSSRDIGLHGWVRVLHLGREDLGAEMLASLGVSKSVPLSEVFELVESRKCALAAISATTCMVAESSPGHPFRGFDIVRRIDATAMTMGWRETFVADDDLDSALEDRLNLALVLPRFGKQDVVSAALARHLLPYKTSMHSVDPRPVGIRFPLERLKQKEPPEEFLSEMVRNARPRLLPAGSSYEGRTYKERLLVIREK